jgi:UDP-GlcNAc:undecaprenyl-phosphate/decaprenyl-phosphate GlcNAc-1-phosphate transferase
MDARIIFAFIASLITVLIVTPFIIKLAIKIGATDKPNERKVHEKLMPRLGGLAIFIGVIVGYLVAGLYDQPVTAITLGGVLIIALGILDDIYDLSAKKKLLGQLLVAGIIVSTGLTIEFISIPFVVERFDLGLWSYPVTILWIVGITNAINLIDGLDGLAGGISAIGMLTIAIMAGLLGKFLILTIAIIVLGSTIGFLFYNFYPAKIFMGDTGALFLGYVISILSLLGLYKSVTLFSFIVPIIILGVPIFDTSFAIIRRIVNKQPISAPDKSHLHHRILALGLSHRSTVLAIYGLGLFFSISALIFSSTTLWGSMLIIFGLLIVIEVIAEMIGLVNERYKPFMKMYRKVTGRQ